MPDDNEQNKQQNTTPPAYTPPATQADLDALIATKVAQFGDYDDLKAKAKQFDDLDAANKTELQKAQDTATAAEKRAQDAEAKVLRAEVAAAKGVPASLISGATKADLEASADALLAFKGPAAKVPRTPGDGGDVNDPSDMSADDVVKAALGR